ncbi:aldo/keto reductase [Filomicrobium sp.]|uniref:aldo/keto reductase n=1 Tax=Filomicrobium sp. TaxID=2024831 RepID=UPI0025871B5C|nr:aldo/keto reductase [Filomicrobium sp.]MCV0370185.1 aldo/keto reductase [Filomicrobium sp.]
MLIGRRTVLQGVGAAAVASVTGLSSSRVSADPISKPLTRTIPSTGEDIPVVGLGSWITFNVGNDPVLLDTCADVVAAFYESGGRLIDSSPMYGSSQATIGYALKKLSLPNPIFSADKIWTSYDTEGASQFAETRALWGLKTMDLMQVHNLLSWRAHIDMLQKKKASGEIRYVGVTTSHGRRHEDLEDIMANHDIDFVQLTYNVLDREPEQRILPLARERGIAVIVNRPYQRGTLIQRFSGKPLPPFAAEIDAGTWPQLLLKFIISHPAITCAIPATTRVPHVQENLAAAAGRLPDEGMRKAITDYVAEL